MELQTEGYRNGKRCYIVCSLKSPNDDIWDRDIFDQSKWDDKGIVNIYIIVACRESSFLSTLILFVFFFSSSARSSHESVHVLAGRGLITDHVNARMLKLTSFYQLHYRLGWKPIWDV